METQASEVPLALRSHTILGVSEAIGDDFGFNPVFLRVPFAAVVLYSPALAVAAYFLLGAVVLLSRLLFPKPAAALSCPVEAIAPPDACDEELPQFARAA